MSVDTNKTSEGASTDLALGGSLIVIDILIIVFNVLTIMVITRFPSKNAVDVFVITLAGHDLVKGLVPVPITIYVYFSSTWHLTTGTVICNLYGWIAFMTNAGSMLILTLMALERFGAIVHPYHYRRWVTTGKVQMTSFLAVVFTAFHSALPLMGVGRMKAYYHQAYSHFDMEKLSGHHYPTFVLCYGLMMVFMVIVAYTFVFHKIRALIRRHMELYHTYSESNNPGGRGFELDMKTETMFSYLALVLMLLFLVSWLPFLIVLMASQLGVTKDFPLEGLHLFAMRIVVVNSMLNPLAYVALCKSYRCGILYYFRKLFSICCGVESSPSVDFWNPSFRGTLARKPKVEHNKESSCDSGFTESHRMPSHFPSYDTYRAKKEEKYIAQQSLLQEESKQKVVDGTTETDTDTRDTSLNNATENERLLPSDNDNGFNSSKRNSGSESCDGCSSIEGTVASLDTTTPKHSNEEIVSQKIEAHKCSPTHPEYQTISNETKGSSPSLVQSKCMASGHTRARRFTQPNKKSSKTEIKTKRRRSKSMTNLLEAGWTPYRLFAKKSASTVEFIFQNSLQCNEIHTLDNLIRREDGSQGNNVGDGASTPLRNLAKMIREFDKSTEEHIRNDEHNETKFCCGSHGESYHLNHHHHHHWKVNDHHCCCCCCCRQRYEGESVVGECVLKHQEQAKSLEHLSSSCQCWETNRINNEKVVLLTGVPQQPTTRSKCKRDVPVEASRYSSSSTRIKEITRLSGNR